MLQSGTVEYGAPSQHGLLGHSTLDLRLAGNNVNWNIKTSLNTKVTIFERESPNLLWSICHAIPSESRLILHEGCRTPAIYNHTILSENRPIQCEQLSHNLQRESPYLARRTGCHSMQSESRLMYHECCNCCWLDIPWSGESFFLLIFLFLGLCCHTMQSEGRTIWHESSWTWWLPSWEACNYFWIWYFFWFLLVEQEMIQQRNCDHNWRRVPCQLCFYIPRECDISSSL